MNFAHPLALLLLLLLIPVVLLYWLRVSVPRETVGTNLFWQKALAEEKLRQSWLRWRARISLPLEMLIVALLALAAAGPQIPPSARMVLILDNSATMRATDVQPTRFEAAKETARRLFEGLRDCDEMAVVTTSPSPMEIQPMTHDPALLKIALNSTDATSEPAAIDWAMKLAREIFAADKYPPRIVLITDACSKEAAKRAQEGGAEVLRVGTAAGNRAITALNARRSKAQPTKCQVFVEVQNQGNQSAQGSLHLDVDEKPASSCEFSIVKDGRWQHVFELDLPEAAILKARIEPGDPYLFDDAASLDIPAATDKTAWKDAIIEWKSRAPASAERPTAPPSSLSSGTEAERLVRLESLTNGRGTDIRVPNTIGSDASTFVAEKPRLPLWIVPAALAAALVIVEWCLFQRRWTC
jgi:hypothetical protein